MKHEAKAAITTTWAQALIRRLRHHFLDAHTRDGLVAIARRLCGVQAQVMSCAEMAIGIRGGDILPGNVRSALEPERTLVKTWAMRGTLHLLPAADLPLYVAALSTRTAHFSEAWVRYFGVTADEIHSVLDAIPQALDGRCLTREALAREVARITGHLHLEKVLTGGWGSALKPAAFRGLLCFGPNEGRNVTFVSARQWIGDWQEIETETAFAEIVRRYLDAYGPATHKDFALWFGIQPGRARNLFAHLADELIAVDVDGQCAWMTRAGTEQLATASGNDSVRLLPGFDPFTIGSLPQLDRLLPAPPRSRVSRTAGWISPVLLVDGRIAGVWKHEIRRGAARIMIEPFAPLPARVRDSAEEHAATIGAFLGAPVETVWTEPSGGV